jgi:hypothetical protein
VDANGPSRHGTLEHESSRRPRSWHARGQGFESPQLHFFPLRAFTHLG